MDGTVFSAEEVAEVRDRYPGLKQVAPGHIKGKLHFEAVFGATTIKDSFDISINVSAGQIFPDITETGGRIDLIAAALGITDTRDLHRNPGGTLCLAALPELDRRVPLDTPLLAFIESFVVPYFYALCVRATGQPWPWGDLGHGALGLLEYYGEHRVDITIDDLEYVLLAIQADASAAWRLHVKSPSAKRICPCGSGEATRDCHRLANAGARHIRAAAVRFNVRLP